MSDIRTSSTPPKTKIFVGRLPENANPQDLRRLFEQYGVVTECDILNRYGFVHMKTEEMAAEAIKALNNADFMGVQISVEQSTGKKSGRGGSFRGGFGPMRGRGGFRGAGGRGSPYMREGRPDFDRRPGMPPPPGVRNGFYDGLDRGYDSYYPSRGPPHPMIPPRERDVERRPYPEPVRPPFERRSFSDVGHGPYERPNIPPVASFERRSDYGAARLAATDIYRRRTPPPASGFGSSGYDREPMDMYGPPARSYEREPLDPYGPPARRYPPAAPLDHELPPRHY